jgi:chromosomal replication initiation ATPase DnaA
MYGVSSDGLNKPGQGATETKNVAMWILREITALRLREIGEIFGGLG